MNLDFRTVPKLTSVGVKLEDLHIRKVDALAREFEVPRSLILREMVRQCLADYEAKKGPILRDAQAVFVKGFDLGVAGGVDLNSAAG